MTSLREPRRIVRQWHGDGRRIGLSGRLVRSCLGSFGWGLAPSDESLVLGVSVIGSPYLPVMKLSSRCVRFGARLNKLRLLAFSCFAR